MASSRRWCLTYNNPVETSLPPHDKLRAAVWQLEKGVSGTPHLQGYAEFSSMMRLSALVKWLPGAHFEIAKGSADQNVSYCSKEEGRQDGPWYIGSFEKSQGKRTDIAAAKDAILGGMTKREVLDTYPDILAKYPRFVDTCVKVASEEKVVKILDFSARFDWQTSVLEMLEEPPHPRQILWLYDPYGNSGKTYMSKYLVDSKGAFYCNGGKSTDITYAYSAEPIVIFDYVRDAKEYVGYGVIEQLKNGIMFSSKYESGQRRFNTPHVIVFANFPPEDGKFSSDRLYLVELDSTHNMLRI